MTTDVKSMSDRELLELLPCLLKKIEAYENKMKEMDKKIKENEKEISSLKERLEAKEEENRMLQNVNEKIEEDLRDLQQRSRHINIVIRGVKEERKENICHRVPSRSSNGPRPIVVRLLNSKTRDKWIKEYKQKQLWKQHLYISEHLTVYNQNLFYHTRKLAKEKKFKFAWTKDCQIYLKRNENSKLYIIKRMADLEMIRSSQGEPSLDETFASMSE
ncbi:hypothetical protein M8J76_011376 [Diaphorina citri]|nr:hypothetical protein M8J76_011376 [Diaphorina citri]